VQPGTGSVFCAINERDLLGDNLAAGLSDGGHAWRFLWLAVVLIGDHEDTRPGGGTRPDLKGKVTIPDVLLQPHSAPLGLAFNETDSFRPPGRATPWWLMEPRAAYRL
jgi:glucose/arabinose dehydrogenase